MFAITGSPSGSSSVMGGSGATSTDQFVVLRRQFLQPVYLCPSAIGVRLLDPVTRQDMENGRETNVIDINQDNTLDYITEYWFNDSRIGTYASSPGHQYGVSNQLLRGIEHPEETVPRGRGGLILRHQGRRTSPRRPRHRDARRAVPRERRGRGSVRAGAVLQLGALLPRAVWAVQAEGRGKVAEGQRKSGSERRDHESTGSFWKRCHGLGWVLAVAFLARASS